MTIRTASIWIRVPALVLCGFLGVASIAVAADDRSASFAALHGVAPGSTQQMLRLDVTQPSPEVDAMVKDVRASADAFIVLSGGASKMSEAAKAELIGLFGAFASLARSGRKFAVGDGGTRAGIMEAAGNARRACDGGFRLVGVSPAPEIAPGKTEIDPHHSDIVAVTNPPWLEEQQANGWQPDRGFWGSETRVMYDIFGAIAAGKPSVAVVANGGGVTLDEVKHNVKQSRKMIVVHGSGRVADAICEVVLGLPHTASADPKIEEEFAKLKGKVEKANLPRELFRSFEVSAGPDAFAAILTSALAGSR